MVLSFLFNKTRKSSNHNDCSILVDSFIKLYLSNQNVFEDFEEKYLESTKNTNGSPG